MAESSLENEDYAAGVRMIMLNLPEDEGEGLGFRLTRTLWDPYPWVHEVTPESRADTAGLKTGDCILQADGKDLLGMPVSQVAGLIRGDGGGGGIALAVWNCGVDPKDDPELLWSCGGGSRGERARRALAGAVRALACAVCGATATRPLVCARSHLYCEGCWSRLDRCALCREQLPPKESPYARNLVAEQVFEAIATEYEIKSVKKRPKETLSAYSSPNRSPNTSPTPRRGQYQLSLMRKKVQFNTFASDPNIHKSTLEPRSSKKSTTLVENSLPGNSKTGAKCECQTKVLPESKINEQIPELPGVIVENTENNVLQHKIVAKLRQACSLADLQNSLQNFQVSRSLNNLDQHFCKHNEHHSSLDNLKTQGNASFEEIKMEEVYVKIEPLDEEEIKKEEEDIKIKQENIKMDPEETHNMVDNKQALEENNEIYIKNQKFINEQMSQETTASYSENFAQQSGSNEFTNQIEITGKVYENGQINRVSCTICNKTFKNRANLKNHIKYIHTDDHNVECDICFRTFKSHVHLKSHTQSVHTEHEELFCGICNKQFQNKRRLQNHIYFTHPEPGQESVCHICKKIYKSLYNLKIHVRQVHPEGKAVSCPHCDKPFKTDSLLQRHIKWSHPSDGIIYKCTRCTKILPSLACLRKHIENAHSYQKSICQLCNRSFKTKKSLDRHVKNLHNDNTNNKVLKDFKPGEFVCSFCDRNFQTNTAMFYHIQRYHTEAKIDTNICSICDKKYCDIATLQRHMSSVHSLETATCNICSKQFKSLINLQSHIRITHAPPESAQMCEICKKTFKCALHLRMHVTTVHQKGDFSCKICQKPFATAKYLKKHERTHIQTRDFCCNICFKTYKTVFAVNKHKKNVHKIGKFNCKKCGESFQISNGINEHVSKCNGETVQSVVSLEIEPEIQVEGIKIEPIEITDN